MDCDGKLMTVALLARGGLLVRGGETLERLRRLLAGGLRLRLVGAAFEQLHLLLELLEVLLEGGGDLGVGEAEAEVRLLDLPVGEVVRAPDPGGEKEKIRGGRRKYVRLERILSFGFPSNQRHRRREGANKKV